MHKKRIIFNLVHYLSFEWQNCLSFLQIYSIMKLKIKFIEQIKIIEKVQMNFAVSDLKNKVRGMTDGAVF